MASSSSSAAAPDATPAFDALSLSPNEREHPCWGCGKSAPPLDQKPFKQCSICVESKYPVPSRFCGPECLKKNRLRHKKWHEKKDAAMEEAAAQPGVAAEGIYIKKLKRPFRSDLQFPFNIPCCTPARSDSVGGLSSSVR